MSLVPCVSEDTGPSRAQYVGRVGVGECMSADRPGLSGITWGGFDNFYYLFSHQETGSTFSIPYDIQILEEVSVTVIYAAWCK
jgi:hypothetical protein